MTLWVHLKRENKRRDQITAVHSVTQNGIVETVDSDGTKVARVVDNTQMDLTDKENLTL